MVYKLKPLELSFDFEDRSYGLGDTVNVEVRLVPNGDGDVREARVDLMLEERFLNVESVDLSVSGRASLNRRNHITRRRSEERKETYVHSSVVFLAGTRLRSGVPSGHTARLRIETVPPRHAIEAAALVRDSHQSWSFKWTLVATVDIVRGRNPERQRAIKVNVPLTPLTESERASRRKTASRQWRDGRQKRL